MLKHPLKSYECQLACNTMTWSIVRASDRVRKNLRNYVAFQGELHGKRRPIVRQIMRYFQVNLNLVFLLASIRRRKKNRRKKTGFQTPTDIYNMKNAFHLQKSTNYIHIWKWFLLPSHDERVQSSSLPSKVPIHAWLLSLTIMSQNMLLLSL